MSGAVAEVLVVDRLEKRFPIQRGFLRRTVAQVRAVDGVSFSVRPGETLCIVGESGCGKTTVAKLIVRLMPPTAGRIVIEGHDITRLDDDAVRPYRRRVQMVFQDPYSSLNPRLSAEQIVTEPIENFQRLGPGERRERATTLLARVGIGADALQKYPFEFSGGQRQRLGVARALSVQPALIIADEPVSALDVSVQAQVLNLLLDLQDEFGLAYVFISHDLGVVRHIGHRIAVMYLGRIVELADAEALFASPQHPYTEALIGAAPVADPRARRPQAILEGEVPSPINPPSGCAFHPRCPFAVARCMAVAPALVGLVDGRLVACHVRAPGCACTNSNPFTDWIGASGCPCLSTPPWCMNRSLIVSPVLPRVSADPDGGRHAERGHPVEHVAANLCLGLLIGQSPAVKPPADNGLVAIHCGFDQAPAIVARTTLPIHASMFLNLCNMSIALRRR